MEARPAEEVISTARRWQRVLLWSAWLIPIGLSIGTYAVVWYGVVLPGRSIAELQQASRIIFYGALASIIVGIFIYQIQSILAQQVATSSDLERKVAERTGHLTEVMLKLEEQNSALLALDQQKSEFVTLVSHELRAPLTNINGGLELLLSRDHDLSPRTRETLELVVAEAGRLTHFVETILNISTLESGRLPVILEPVGVEAAIKHVIGQFSKLSAGRLAADIEPELPPVLADERYMQSVIFHLVDNALKYAPTGPVQVSAYRNGDYMSVCVKDAGPGIPPALAARLFSKFERLGAQDSQSVYGYGLGLYMCKRIMEVLKGNISLKPGNEPGATFEITLPVWAPPASDSPVSVQELPDPNADNAEKVDSR